MRPSALGAKRFWEAYRAGERSYAPRVFGLDKPTRRLLVNGRINHRRHDAPEIIPGEPIREAVRTPEDILIERDDLRFIECLMIKRLTPREERAARMYYGFGWCEPHTLDQIGEALSVTRERVRQIVAKANRKLHRPLIPHLRGKYTGRWHGPAVRLYRQPWTTPSLTRVVASQIEEMPPRYDAALLHDARQRAAFDLDPASVRGYADVLRAMLTAQRLGALT